MSDTKNFYADSKLSELVACLEMATDHLSEIMLRQAIKQMLEREYGAVFDDDKKVAPSETEWKIHKGNRNPEVGRDVEVIFDDGSMNRLPSNRVDWSRGIERQVMRYRAVK